jgi:transcriptional regulator with XRE-family HTH domain
VDVSAAVLLAARRSRGLSQRALAARAGEHQPTISALENGDHDPGLAHLTRLLAATGHRLVALPTTSRPVYEAAADMAAALRRGDDAAAYREFIQLSDDLARETGPLRVALTALAPAPINPRYDALLASVTEHYLSEARLPVPAWVYDLGRVLTDPWFVDDVPALLEATVAETPKAFARHGVFLVASELASV